MAADFPPPPGHIFITGASSGIGAALALHYARTLPGVCLTLCGRNEDRLEDVAKECRDAVASVFTATADVASRKAMEEAFLAADERMTVDLVIANAGISGGTEGGLEAFDQVRRIFEVNLTGVLNTVEPAARRMIARGRGQIALMSSLAGFRGWAGAPAYCGSKAAVKVFGEGWRGSLAKKGVRVSVICPGFVKSPMTDVNAFPMPFMIEADKAAAVIARGLARDKSRIAFPLPMHALSWLACVLPDSLMQRFSKAGPAKATLEGM